jgi:hypothetical protein
MGKTVAERSCKDDDFLCNFLYLAWRLWKSVVTLALTGNTTSGQVFGVSGCQCLSEASIVVDRKSMGHTVAERS